MTSPITIGEGVDSTTNHLSVEGTRPTSNSEEGVPFYQVVYESQKPSLWQNNAQVNY